MPEPSLVRIIEGYALDPGAARIGAGTRILLADGRAYVLQEAVTATAPTSVALGSATQESTVLYVCDITELPEDAKIEYVTVNLQLQYWRDAKALYRQLRDGARLPTYADFDRMLMFLATSLTRLFGRNWTERDRDTYNEKVAATGRRGERGRRLRPLQQGRTPSLLEFVRDCYPMARDGWSLHCDDPELYRRLERLAHVHNDCVKHYEASKQQTIFSITMDDMADFAETTRLTWIWYLGKYYPSGIPGDLVSEFRDE